jgi:uncharacterized integral membrane protein
MDGATAVLASLAPGLALFVEWRHPVESEMALRHAERIMMELGLTTNDPRSHRYRDALRSVLANTTLGAVAVANLILTIAATLTGMLAVAYEFGDWLWWAGTIVLLSAIAAALILYLIRTETVLDVATVHVELWPGFSRTKRELFSYAVYGTNVSLLVVILLTYWVTAGQYLILSDHHYSLPDAQWEL